MVRLFTSMNLDDWNENYLINGVFDRDKILAQKIPWVLSKDKDYILIEFEKPLNEIFIDWDECEIRNLKIYSELNVDNLTFFGAYVKNIKPNEIIRKEIIKH